MATTAKAPQTKIDGTLNIKKDKVTKQMLIEKVINLGSPISGKQLGDIFSVTLNGEIILKSYGSQKGAYHGTKEGYQIRVNAGFDPEIHGEGKKVDCICLEWVNEELGTKGKYCAFYNA